MNVKEKYRDQLDKTNKEISNMGDAFKHVGKYYEKMRETIEGLQETNTAIFRR